VLSSKNLPARFKKRIVPAVTLPEGLFWVHSAASFGIPAQTLPEPRTAAQVLYDFTGDEGVRVCRVGTPAWLTLKEAGILTPEENTGRIKVASKAERTNDEGVVFASRQEKNLIGYLLTLVKREHVILQPRFTLQGKVTDAAGTKFRAVDYVADCVIGPWKPGAAADKGNTVIDIKGMMTADFKIKWKLFVGKYGQTLHLPRCKRDLVEVLEKTGWITAEAAAVEFLKLPKKKIKCLPISKSKKLPK
jgi:hypothetical protein